MAASAVSAAAYAMAGDKKEAVAMAATVALAAVGAGAAVKAFKVAKVAVRASQARKAADELTFTVTAASHADRAYLKSRLVVKEIMKTKAMRDPGGMKGAVAWHAPGKLNGKGGIYELVVHPQSKRIVHFMFRRRR